MARQIQNVDCLIGMKELENNSIDLIITDPPYEIEDMTPYFSEFVRLLKQSGSIYIFGNKNMIADKWFSQLEINHKELLVWHYKNSPKPKGRWRMSMQPIIYGYKSADLSVFNEDEARVEYQPATKKLNGRVRPSPGRLTECKKYDTSKGALPRDIIEHPALTGHLSRERVGHPDQKPLRLIEKLVKTSSNKGDIVLDAFAGTGTTVVACVNTNRKYIAFEKDERWIDMIYGRMLTAKFACAPLAIFAAVDWAGLDISTREICDKLNFPDAESDGVSCENLKSAIDYFFPDAVYLRNRSLVGVLNDNTAAITLVDGEPISHTTFVHLNSPSLNKKVSLGNIEDIWLIKR